MEINSNHWLTGDKITIQESGNISGHFNQGMPDTIVVHFTAGGSAESSANWLCNPDAKASAHVLIGQEGEIIQLVPFNRIAWHAGRSEYNGRKGFNNFSIGIEIDNAGRLTKSGSKYYSWFGKEYDEKDVIEGVHRNETEPGFWHRYTEKQIEKVWDFSKLIVQKYPISLIVGHEEINPAKKFDPGPAFPLDVLRERLLNQDRDQDRGIIDSSDNFGYVKASKLNIRSTPGYEAPPVTKPLVKNTKVKILSEYQGWFHVAIETKGWVKKEYIEKA